MTCTTTVAYWIIQGNWVWYLYWRNWERQLSCSTPRALGMTALSKQRQVEFVRPLFLALVWQNDTNSCACPDSICNHTEQSVESGVKALWGAIWAISKQHLPQPHKGKKRKKKSFPQRSGAHFEHIIVLLFPYSLITVQSDYRVENKGRGWKIPSTIDEVNAGLFVSLST